MITITLHPIVFGLLAGCVVAALVLMVFGMCGWRMQRQKERGNG